MSLHRTNLASVGAMVAFDIQMPLDLSEPPPTGTIDALARIPRSSNPAHEAPASFEIVHIDLPPTDPLRTAGRITVSAEGWEVDFSFDLRTEHVVCF